MFFLSTIRNWLVARNRDLFLYSDGTRTRRGDPIRIATRLETECPNYIDLLNAAVKDVAKVPVGPMRDDARTAKKDAVLKLTATARTIFDLRPLGDTTGTTDGEALRTLTAFFVYMEGLADQAQVFTDSQAVA